MGDEGDVEGICEHAAAAARWKRAFDPKRALIG